MRRPMVKNKPTVKKRATPRTASRAASTHSLPWAFDILSPLLSSVPVGVCVADLEGRVVYANTKFSHLFGNQSYTTGEELRSLITNETIISRLSIGNLYLLDGTSEEIFSGSESSLYSVSFSILSQLHDGKSYLVMCSEDLREVAHLRGQLSRVQAVSAVSNLATDLLTALSQPLCASEKLIRDLTNHMRQSNLILSLCNELIELPHNHPARSGKEFEIQTMTAQLNLPTILKEVNHALTRLSSENQALQQYLSSLREIAISHEQRETEIDINNLIEKSLLKLNKVAEPRFCVSLALSPTLPLLWGSPHEFESMLFGLFKFLNNCLESLASVDQVVYTLDIETEHSAENDEIFIGIRFSNTLPKELKDEEAELEALTYLAQIIQEKSLEMSLIFVPFNERRHGEIQIEFSQHDEILFFIRIPISR